MYNILDYGAVPGGKTICTAAIQAAIDACAVTGGTVLVPAGLYLTGTIWLRSNVELHLEQGATLKASDNLNDYNNDRLDPVQDTDYPQNIVCEVEEWRGKHLIIALECENVSLTGKGTIDGSADAFFEDIWFRPHTHYFYYPEGWVWAKDKKNLRPGQVVVFVECRHVNIQDITVCNAPCWDIFLHGCDYVQVRGIHVHNPRWFINTDGIDIDCCSYVTVSDCVIDTGDDCITVRGDPRTLTDKTKKAQYISISNCSLSTTCHAFRIGVGDGIIEHVTVDNCSISRCGSPIAFTGDWNPELSTGISDVYFHNIIADEASSPLWLTGGKVKGIRHILIENYICRRVYSSMWLYSANKEETYDIVMRNVDLTYVDKTDCEHTPEFKEQRGHQLVSAHDISGLTFDNMKLHGDPEFLKEFDQILDIRSCPGMKLINVELP